MATLGVEVAGAGVELRFDGHRFRMVVKLKELDPVWNQPLYSEYSDLRTRICSKLCPLTLEASVYRVNESAQGSSSDSVELDLASMSSFIQRLNLLCDFVLEAYLNESAQDRPSDME
ncbi:hypothetical protein TRIUR3_29277 [Triticum urartu]|uniref:Uncharacterized protein n=1 Tax=Triticum urartu TaxID=4572 RepID=M7ZEE8_TRIUA|nr:hypothetical protein TRIUR3_29277 [Triticum urartu]